jgi:uncharacterized protein
MRRNFAWGLRMQGLSPRITPLSAPYWQALDHEQIRLQKCCDCGRFVFYPRSHCPFCASRSLEWAIASDTPRLYTWTIAERPVSAAFQHLRRPILAVAELHGVHLPTSIVETPPEEIRIGMELRPVFDRTSYPGVTLLRFTGYR